MRAVAAGSVVLITGGTGSFGSQMVRSLLRQDVHEVRVFSRDEEKQDGMRRALADSRVRYYLGDVRDLDSVRDASSGVDYVFHAAALKQVPSCEFFPDQAVATNVRGSDNVIRAAAAAGVRSVVCLSTDKAVHPVNAMGMTKALMEKTAQAYARNHPNSRTVVSCVRYGNVMYSRGSVIPLFIEQAKAGLPLTITEPRMTRFLMSLDESVDLVEFAFAQAEPGDLFVRKAPAATVQDLASAVSTLLGVEAAVRVIGPRHGEKMHETLLSAEEMAKAKDCGSYYRIPLDARSLNYSLYFEGTGKPWDGSTVCEYDSSNTRQLSVDEIVELLISLPQVREQLAR